MATPNLLTKGCAAMFACWLALAGAYGYVAWQQTHVLVPTIVVGVLGSTFSAIFISSFVGLFTGGHDRNALRRAINGEAPRDGHVAAASGPIRAVGAALEAPFSGRACVAYDYDVKAPGGERSDFTGMALAPCAIDTPRGPARVLGWAMLDQFPAVQGDEIDRTRAKRYLSAASFEPLGLTSMLSVLSELIADDDGALRKDYRIGDGVVDLHGRWLQERALPVGTPVTILGRWSESRQGFVPAGATSMNRLFPGDLAATRSQVGGNAIKAFAIATVFFVILHSMLGAIYVMSTQATKVRAAAESVWDERDCDRLKQLLAGGANPNERGHDAITPLMNAAREGEPACVSNLIAAGANLEDRDRWSDTALGEAVVAGRDENVRLLLAAGAKDFRVTAATGRPIDAGAAPVAAVRDYVAAVHSGDFETMARLMAHSSVARMQDSRADLPFWQSMRPKAFTIVEGWMTDDAATLTIRGVTKDGERRVCYQVTRVVDGSQSHAEADKADTFWQIQKEWFPDIH